MDSEKENRGANISWTIGRVPSSAGIPPVIELSPKCLSMTISIRIEKGENGQVKKAQESQFTEAPKRWRECPRKVLARDPPRTSE